MTQGPQENPYRCQCLVAKVSLVADQLVGISEIAGLLGVSRQRAVQVVRDYADFPAPTATLASGRIWERQAVEAWIGRHRERKPGRPPRNVVEEEAGDP